KRTALEEFKAIFFQRSKRPLVFIECKSVKSTVANRYGALKCGDSGDHSFWRGWLSKCVRKLKSIIWVARNASARPFDIYPHFTVRSEWTESLFLKRSETTIPHEVWSKSNVKQRWGMTYPGCPLSEMLTGRGSP